jgi:tRNA(Ile)-lysidine synthase
VDEDQDEASEPDAPVRRRVRRHPSLARALGLMKRVVRSREARAEDPWSHLRGAGVVLACSGGRDSTALAGLMKMWVRRFNLRLSIAHVDHGLRPASASEAAHVERVARQLDLPVRVIRLAGTRHELEPGPGLPARARVARRAVLRAWAEERGARWIALGHTATDQAETCLMHLVRGAGLEGVAAMASVDAPWLRPLLGLTRAETRALCSRLALPFVDDPTNVDPAHFRVRIREQVLPLLRRENPHIERALTNTSEQARDAEEALARWTGREERARRLERGLASAGQGWSHEGLHELPRAIRTRLIRQICLAGGADREALTYAIIADIDRALVARACATAPHGHALAPREWAVRPRIRLRLDARGVWVGPVNH